MELDVVDELCKVVRDELDLVRTLGKAAHIPHARRRRYSKPLLQNKRLDCAGPDGASEQ